MPGGVPEESEEVTVDIHSLHETTDAQVWAREWCRVAHDRWDNDEEVEGVEDLIDEGWMIGWFANAIEVGRAAGRLEATIELARSLRDADDDHTA